MDGSTMRLVIFRIFVALSVLRASVLTCRVDMCSREYSSVIEMAQSQSPTKSDQYCSLLHAFQQCIKSIARSCRGNLEFHTIQTLLKQWKDYNCTGTGGGVLKNRNIVTLNQRKSGFNEHHQQRILQQQQRLQQCLSAAYNYTINKDNNSDMTSRIRDERVVPTVVADDKTNSKSNNNGGTRRHESDPSLKRTVKRFRSRMYRNANNSPLKGVPLIDDDDDDDSDNDEDDGDNNYKNNSEHKQFALTESSHPIVPSPPLTCLIFGDPHLRTLTNEHQTCKCIGAWPLIDHPLFAVQITNTQFKGLGPQVTGVTKVTVLVRQFMRCGISNDLLYEAESGADDDTESLPSTFVDGSTSTSNNLIRITSSSNNNVVTMHLDHIGVRVYIGQFSSSNFLNVIIKFRSATSIVKQQFVLNSISANSLCKSGCPPRERIDIRPILEATGVNLETIIPKEGTDIEDFADTRAILANDAASDNGNSDDPCKGLYGYYRISCLYDVAIKGVKHVNNACRFAQSFDEMRNVYPTIVGDNSKEISVEMLNKSHGQTQYLSLLTLISLSLYILIL